MKNFFVYIFLLAGLVSCGPNNDRGESLQPGEIKINWADNLQGDFSFSRNWDYPEGVYKNDFGQLSCDGFCPSGTDRMKDETGKIFEDSLEAFYKLVDTTHQFYSIKSDAWCYEWAGTNFATATKSKDTVFCFTHNNAATHSRLNLIITGNRCTPLIKLSSIAGPGETRTYLCNGGQIEIDRNLYDKGILKAKFDFTFDHKENPAKPMFWKGEIYTEIKAK